MLPVALLPSKSLLKKVAIAVLIAVAVGPPGLCWRGPRFNSVARRPEATLRA